MAKLYKVLVVVFIVASIAGIAINQYNKSVENKAIDTVLAAIATAFEASAKYESGSDRIIVEIYDLKNENELYELTSKALPIISPIGEYNVVELLSVRTYYEGNKDDYQFYDIKFKDIGKIEWAKIHNFNDFLSYTNLNF